MNSRWKTSQNTVVQKSRKACMTASCRFPVSDHQPEKWISLHPRTHIQTARRGHGHNVAPRGNHWPWTGRAFRVASQRCKDSVDSPLRRPAKRPSTPICSSRCGHSMAYPSPSNVTFSRSAPVPWSSLGYHANGTVNVRPSTKSTMRVLWFRKMLTP